MISPPDGTYPPLNTLKPIADDVWVVDGPAIRFGLPGLRMGFPTRMTVIRLADRSLFVHSPTPLVDPLRAEIDRAGTVRWIVGPNTIHYWWIPQWRTAFADAAIYLAPGVCRRAGHHIDFDTRTLAAASGYPWDDAIATVPMTGSITSEAAFFHHASATLLLTDLIENFEPQRLHSIWARWLTRLGGAQDPHGSMPRDMRWTYRHHLPALKSAVERMIGWDPVRIILAHGRWYDREGAAELRRAFAWLLH